MGWREQCLGPRKQEEHLEAVLTEVGQRTDGFLELGGNHVLTGQSATAPQGRQGERGASWRAAGGCLSYGENFYGERRERSVSRVNRENGFLSVDAEISVCGQLFRGHWNTVNLKPVCLESVYDPHAWSREILAAGLVSSNGPDGAASCT